MFSIEKPWGCWSGVEWSGGHRVGGQLDCEIGDGVRK